MLELKVDMKADEIEAHIIDLESRLAFQDMTVQQLNEIVVRQQDQLDALQRNYDMLLQWLRSHMESSEINTEPERPPHY